MRQPIKSVSTKPEKYIPKAHREDPDLSESAKEIKDRPLVFWWKRLTREDNYNIGSLIEAKRNEDELSIKNLGSLARYIWENCITQVDNVLLDDGAYDSLKGAEKNRLFATQGLDLEIAEVIRHVQEQSSFTETEVKN